MLCNKVNNNSYFYDVGMMLLKLVKTPLKVDLQQTEIVNLQ